MSCMLFLQCAVQNCSLVELEKLRERKETDRLEERERENTEQQNGEKPAGSTNKSSDKSHNPNLTEVLSVLMAEKQKNY